MKQLKILFAVLLIAIVLCACTTTDNTVSTNSEKITVSEVDNQKTNPDDLLKDFIVSKKYLEHTTDQHELSYVLTDINADGTNELLMQSEEEIEFHDMWIFAVENDAVKLVFKHYGFGSFRYFKDENTVIVPPEFRPFMGTSHYAFYSLKDGEFKEKFSVGEGDVDKYFYRDSNGSKEISLDEFTAYFTEATFLEWTKIN